MLTLVLLIIATALLLLLAYVGYHANPERSTAAQRGDKHPGRAMVFLLLVPIAWLACSITTVGANTQSVRTSFGRVTSVLGSGLHFVAPWSGGTDFSSANQWVKFEDKGDGDAEPKIKVRLAGQSTADLAGVISYTQPPDKVDDLFLTWKTEERIRELYVKNLAQQALNEAFGTYDPLANAKQEADVLATYSKRATEILQSKTGGMLTNVSISLSDLDLDDTTEARLREIQQAIAKFRVAEQDRLTAEQVALANKIIAESLKGDATAAFYQCVKMFNDTLREIKPQQVNITAVCANAISVAGK